jgi:prolipoprotein diacylglyceryltransferase
MERASKARTISAPLTREKRCSIETLKYLLKKKKKKKKRILFYYCYYLYSLGFFRFSVNCNRVWTSVVLNYCVEGGQVVCVPQGFATSMYGCRVGISVCDFRY